MGYTHFRSNVVGQAGTERVASFVFKPKELNLTNSTNSYITLGANNAIFWGSLGNKKAIALVASAVGNIASGCGWIYLSSNAATGGVWAKANGTNASIVRLNVTGVGGY